MLLSISPEGTVTVVAADDELKADLMGSASKVSVARASHIYPSDPLLEATFRCLRRIFGDNGRVAAWTRNWPCFWYVDLRLSGGKRHGLFRNRHNAIAFEQKWLEENEVRNGR